MEDADRPPFVSWEIFSGERPFWLCPAELRDLRDRVVRLDEALAAVGAGDGRVRALRG